MSQQAGMSFKELRQRFQTEEACEAFLFEQRWPEGFVCPKCGGHGSACKLPRKERAEIKPLDSGMIQKFLEVCKGYRYETVYIDTLRHGSLEAAAGPADILEIGHGLRMGGQRFGIHQ